MKMTFEEIAERTIEQEKNELNTMKPGFTSLIVVQRKAYIKGLEDMLKLHSKVEKAKKKEL